MPQTILQQYQIAKSSNIDDALDLLGYANINDLEGDLNFLRSVLKDLKGTAAYETPVTQTLLDLETTLANAVFNNAQLTGTPVATTAVNSNRSTRIATTEFVHNLIDATIVAGGGDARFVYTQPSPSTSWNVTHNLGKRPAIEVVDSAGTVVYGEYLYIDDNNVQLNFSAPFSGSAYFN